MFSKFFSYSKKSQGKFLLFHKFHKNLFNKKFPISCLNSSLSSYHIYCFNNFQPFSTLSLSHFYYCSNFKPFYIIQNNNENKVFKSLFFKNHICFQSTSSSLIGKYLPNSEKVFNSSSITKIDYLGRIKSFSTLIQIENTPNPNAKIFYPQGYKILPQNAPKSVSFDLNSINDSSKPRSPLAEALLKISGIYSILFCEDYLTVVKQKSFEWDLLEKDIINKVKEFSELNLLPSFEELSVDINDNDKIDSESKNNEEIFDSDYEEIIDAIKTLINTRARPMVMEDGGDIEFIRFDEDEGIVWIYMKGACEGCPSSTLTLQEGLASMLRYFIPEVKHVKQCDENGDPLIDDDEDT